MIVNCKNCNKEIKNKWGKTFCCKECRNEYSKQFKIILICEQCNSQFTWWKNAKIKKFCSTECYHKTPKKKLSKEAKKNQIKGAKNYYKNTSIEILQKRWDKIGESKKVHLTNEEILRIEEILKLGYIRDKNLLLKLAKIENKSYKALNNYIKSNPEWIKQFKRIPGGGLDWKIQSLEPIKFLELLEDLKNQTIKFVKEKWEIGEKTQVRLRKFYNLANKYNLDKKESRPESIIRNILKELQIEFEREKYLCRRFRVDFVINRKVIEVQGDYWHANPSTYKNDDKLSNDQWSNKINDLFKKDWLLNNDYEILYIWEEELENIDIVKQKIKDYLCIK